MKSIPSANSEIGAYRQGWNDAMLGQPPRYDRETISIAYAIGYADAKQPKVEKQ
ncbi:hypothetical protein CPT_Maja_051 [Burkholderia phage Maja]|uniref:Uncharacterized protein n=1 Tax=Burkholderia phage Maja TaxID=2767571 RepID=A0A7S6U363_9CAUD|nr:hypothetical protein CPT_Maja_051 [Burkholderia phage Maja]